MTNNAKKSAWDVARIREAFKQTAREAEHYWDEIYPKVISRPAYKHLVDEMVAKFYVYDGLAARQWSTAQDLVKAARELLEVEIDERQMFDRQRVKRHQEHFLRNVIDRYEN